MHASRLIPLILLAALGARADEALPGGEATYRGPLDRNAFSHPSANLTGEAKLDFQVGNGLFKRLWVSAPSSTRAADGLGPLYNARSCRACHINDGRGHPPEGPDDNAVSMFLRLSIPPRNEAERRRLAQGRIGVIPEPTYGTQLQDFAIRGHRPEGRMVIEYDEVPLTLADGETVSLRDPRYSITDLAYGPLHPDTMISPRVAPPMIGLGLLEAIDEQAILDRADPADHDGDGISGRASRVWSPTLGRFALGRFGWKAGSATLDEQSQSAFAGDIGISVPLHPAGHGECSEAQTVCRLAPDGNSPRFDGLEAPKQVTDRVAHYARHLAVPARRDLDDPRVGQGQRLFRRLGCDGCHAPSHVTRDDYADPALAGQTIHPYTDLLLHDLGEGLADHRPEGVASGREWRTAPLWGIGLTAQVNGPANFLHDGRARTPLEAILWHGGEAQRARDGVVALSREERAALLRFIESL